MKPIRGADRVQRPDLGRRALLVLLAGFAVLAILFSTAVAVGTQARSGDALLQSMAIVGALLLLVPLLFSLGKRSGLAQRPPAWFVGHVLASLLGALMVLTHAAAGSLWSPPGVLVLALLFLIIQGTFARAFLARRLSALFASRITPFTPALESPRAAIAEIIASKVDLLKRLDPAADEALFSPNLHHWIRHPGLALRYNRLALAEARLVGARRQAGPVLALWRRMHIAVAVLFLLGLCIHVLLVVFFAGYVAQGEDVYWWHLAAWGGPP